MVHADVVLGGNPLPSVGKGACNSQDRPGYTVVTNNPAISTAQHTEVSCHSHCMSIVGKPGLCSMLSSQQDPATWPVTQSLATVTEGKRALESLALASVCPAWIHHFHSHSCSAPYPPRVGKCLEKENWNIDEQLCDGLPRHSGCYLAPASPRPQPVVPPSPLPGPARLCHFPLGH